MLPQTCTANLRCAAEQAPMFGARTTLVDWIQLIRSEYLEMPGLHLTRPQVQRLSGLDTHLRWLLEALIDVKFLRKTHAGAYVRADAGGREHRT